MKKDIALRWAHELRSGNYKQNTEVMKSRGADGFYHCCLGVLCEMAIKAGVRIDQFEKNGIFSFEGNLKTLPGAVKKWAGLASTVGAFSGTSHTLSKLNDAGVEFSFLADVIERDWFLL